MIGALLLLAIIWWIFLGLFLIEVAVVLAPVIIAFWLVVMMLKLLEGKK